MKDMLKYCTADKFIPFLVGVTMSINFIFFWAIPVAGMGSLYKELLKPYLQPVYLYFEGHPGVRKFAADYIYTKPEHADFFALSLGVLISCSISIPTMFYWQLTTGSLPFWLIFLYYCSWVGIGGSMMGTAYGLAHKEGHYMKLYRPWVRNYIGHPFENVLGLFFGNVPWNFTTSHIGIHHKTNGGIGDTFYLWDLDRSSVGDFMLYIHRVLLHMVGYSSIKFFRANNRHDKAELLWGGVQKYIFVGIIMLAITRSFSFVFWLYLQPLFCMTYFLALLNIGFHGFLEYHADGSHISVVDASTIVDGDDDLFGEDDHMAHHYNTAVYYRDLKTLQASKESEFAQYKASVFQKLSIVELSIFIVFGLWDKLADHYVDYTGKMSKEEIKTLLQTRAQRIEIDPHIYAQYLQHPTMEARNTLRLNSHTTNTTVTIPSSDSDSDFTKKTN